jgi:hypothetical protein
MIELIGDPDAETCEDGFCAVPAGPRREDADPPKDDSANSHPRRRVEVQRLGDPLQRRVRA